MPYFLCSATQFGQGASVYYKGLYYGALPPSGAVETWGKGYFLYADSDLLSDTLLMDNGGLRVAEARNGDMLMLKKAIRWPAYSQNWNYLPFLMRATETGDSVWTRFYTHLNTTDTNIDQYLNAMSVAPDGRIVLGGAVKSARSVPGLFDTTGSVSWLLVLDDSAHDTITGISEWPAEGDPAVMVYPNPATEAVTLRYADLQVKSMRLAELSGRTIRVFPAQDRTLSLKGLAPGMYLLELETNMGKYIKKLVIR